MTSEIKLQPPKEVQLAMDLLGQAGFDAFCVGGCVRDSLLGISPKDFDLSTNATPAQMEEVFAGYRLLDLGRKHGTITLLTHQGGVEITTFRTEQGYEDFRHPDKVTFVSGVEEDLARRDFTINAMAWSEETGLIDPFGGAEDLQQGILCCVGNPKERFCEDPLRILRLLRFASRFGFLVEEATKQGAKEHYPLLEQVSRERISSEWMGLLEGEFASKVIGDFSEIVFFLFPSLAPMKGCSQQTKYHYLDVWEHTLEVMRHLPGDPILRMAGLFHDAGKPDCKWTDEAGVDHFHLHPQRSATLAREEMERWRMEKETIQRVCQLVTWHDDRREPTPANARRFLASLGAEELPSWAALRRADILGQHPDHRAKSLDRVEQMETACRQVLERGDCFSLKQLAVGGRELMALGVPAGPKVGELLWFLLEGVLEGDPNDAQFLLKKAKERLG